VEVMAAARGRGGASQRESEKNNQPEVTVMAAARSGCHAM